MTANPRRLTLAFLVAFTCATSLLHAADYKPATRGQPEKKFVVQPGGQLIFDADLGHGEVETGDYESVRVEFQSYYKVDTAEEVEALYDKLSIDMQQTGNTVKVTVRFADENQANREKVRLNFKVAMPRKFNLELRTGGSARIGDVDGTVKASTIGGSLQVEDVTGALTASSKGGSLTIGKIGGDLDAQCEGGSTAIERADGRVRAKTNGGTLDIDEAAVAIDATANGGWIKASLSKTPTSDCKITANGGGIDLSLPESAAVTIDAASTSGGITSDFGIKAAGSNNRTASKGTINGGGPLLTLRATGGSIHLNKR